jgi:hypothetical protein
MTKWSSLGDSTELSRVGLSHIWKKKCDCGKTNSEMSKLNNFASDISPAVLVEYSLNHLRVQKRAPGDGKRACLESVLQVVDI